MNVLELKCLRSLVGVSRMDRVRNEDVCRRAGIETELASRADQRVLSWFGHVERLDEYRMARIVLMADESGVRVRGRPRLGWMDDVMMALGSRGMTVEAARLCANDGKEWRALVHIYTIEFNTAIFAWPCFLSDRLPALWWIITWRGVGCCYVMRFW